MDLTFGITLHFKKEKPARMLGKVFYTETNKGPQHVIELHDAKTAGEFIKGFLPPYPEEEMTQTQQKKETHGIG